MDCARCLEENQKSIEINGYGYGYIGNEHNCQRHSNKSNADNAQIYQATGLKWTDGQPYERSRRMKHQIEIENQKFSKDMESSAYTSSLHHDENTWDILNQSLSGAGFKVSNKREELGNKLAGREMIQQIGFNPFLSQTNYVDDITIRDQFLKPINTTHDDTSSLLN
jgi:hypothetical protein